MKSIAVFLGGVSVEHDVSLITGTFTLNSLDKEKFIPIPIYVHKTGEWYTGDQLFDLDEYNRLQIKKLKKVTVLSGTNQLVEIKGKKLKNEKDELLKVNGKLYQRIGFDKEETKEEKEENDDTEEIKIEDVIDEKGELI